MSTPTPIVFTTLIKGFSWTPSTVGEGGVPLPPGETESGTTIGIRADGDAAHSPGNYQYLVIVPPTQNSEAPAAINAALGKNLPPGNYWAALDQTDMLAGTPSTSAWTPEVPFSIPTPIVKPASPTNFSAA
jgi:hypothetical protein